MAALSLFFKEGGKALTKKGREALKALREMERGVSTRAGGKKAQGVEYVDKASTPIRELGKTGLKQTGKGTRMATGAQRDAVIKSGRKRIIGGAAGIGVAPVIVDQLLKADEEATDGSKKDKTGLKDFGGKGSGKSSGKGSGKGSGKSTGAKTESKTFRERRLARMKKRLEAAENEGRKRRLKRRIGRVEGRIEDTKERRAARGKAGGGEMVKASVPGYKDGDLVKKQGYNARLDESLGSRNGSKTQSMKDRRDESKGMEKSMGRRAYSGNKSSGQTKSRKPSRPQSAGVAKRGWGAAIR